MKRAFILLGGWLLAGLPAGAATTVAQDVDGGGGRATAGGAVADQGVGGFAGISTAGGATAKHGYVGQLYDATAFAATPEAAEMDEADSQQLDGVATLDDDTRLAVAGDETAWDAAVFPLADISAAGLATAANVYEDTSAVVTGRYLTLVGVTNFLVRNTGTDDFDTYAGDGLPDDWQVDHFGIGSADAGPTNNVDEDPFDNEGEWIADTDPLDEDSYFRIVAVTDTAAQVEMWFDSSSARRYSLQKKTDLLEVDWEPVDGQTDLAGTDAMRSLVESNPPVGPHHYRVGVQVP